YNGIDADDGTELDMLRTQSTAGKGRNGDTRPPKSRTLSRREVDRRRQYDDDGEDIYGVYDDYYDDKPQRSLTTRRPLQRGLSRSRTGSLSRGRRSVEDED